MLAWHTSPGHSRATDAGNTVTREATSVQPAQLCWPSWKRTTRPGRTSSSTPAAVR
ncbi:MAG: hypothetical protein ACYS30_18525 [Planctomycetota bacterium]